MMVIGATMIFVALVADWIGSSKYENLYYMGRIFDKYNSQIWIDEYYVD